MGTEKNPAIGNEQSVSDLTSEENQVEGKRLHLNKQTLQDLSPTDAHADKVRGGAKPCSAGVSGCGDT